jgi:hypothetical protein
MSAFASHRGYLQLTAANLGSSGIQLFPYGLMVVFRGSIKFSEEHKGRLFLENIIWWTMYLSKFLIANLLWKFNLINLFFILLIMKIDKLMVCDRRIKFGGCWYNNQIAPDWCWFVNTSLGLSYWIHVSSYKWSQFYIVCIDRTIFSLIIDGYKDIFKVHTTIFYK